MWVAQGALLQAKVFRPSRMGDFGMKSYFVSTFLFIFAACVFGWRDGDMEVKVNDLTKSQLEYLKTLHLNGDVWPSATAAKATFYVNAKELDKLRQAGISYTITIADMKAQYKDFWENQAKKFHSSQAGVYHSYDQIIAVIDSLAMAYPSICVKIPLGVSVQNRQLCMLKISNNAAQHENEAQICFDAGIHGDELGGPEVLLLFARELCSNYGQDTMLTRLINSREIFIYCMVNPDGRANMTRENANNVDCNRDEGYMWGGEGGSVSVCSQPETKALRAAMVSNRFVIHLCYHCGAEEILYPWCWTGSAAPDRENFIAVTSAYASASDYATFPDMQSYADYPTRGETIDMAYGAMGISAATIELSTDKQPVDIAGYYAQNVAAMIAMIHYAGYGIEGTISDSADGSPISAILYADSSLPFYSDPNRGDYHKFLKAGTYNLKVQANAYFVKTISNCSVRDGQSTVIPIRLQRDPQPKRCFGYRVMSVDNATGPTFSVLGPPDGKPCVLSGSAGMVVDMQYPVWDTVGKEIVVHVSGAASPYTCYAGQSPDGPWMKLGNGLATDSFDVGAGSLKEAQYIKIQGAAIGLDAVEGAWIYTSPMGIQPQRSPKKPSPFTGMTVSNNGGNPFFRVNGPAASLKAFDLGGKCRFAGCFDNGIYAWRPDGKGIYIIEASWGGQRVTRRCLFIK
jgi:hypothetical protein